MKSASAPDGGLSAYAGAAVPIMAAALINIRRRFLLLMRFEYPRTHPACSAGAVYDKCSAGVNDDAALRWRALGFFVALGVGHRQRQRQFFQRASLGRDTKPQFDEA